MKNKETLEEAAERYAENWNDPENQFVRSSCFIAGAMYEQEQDKNKYSEEEVLDMMFEVLNQKREECCITHTRDSIVRKVFEQFKKK